MPERSDYREHDTFSGVTIGVKKKRDCPFGDCSFFLCFSFSRTYSIKSCKKRLTSFWYKSGFKFHDRMWVAPRKGA